MSFEARYRGECTDCWDEITPGEQIESNDLEDGYRHVRCPGSPPRVNQETCKTCYQVKSSNGSCACE